MTNLFLSVMDASSKDPKGTDILTSIIIAVCAIVVVFIILYLIVLCIQGMQKVISKVEKKENQVEEKIESPKQAPKSVEIVDEDMMVAALIATIDYTNETKKDVRLKSIKRIG